MCDAAAHQSMSFFGSRQISTNKVLAHHLSVRIDKQQPIALRLIGQTVANSSTPHIVFSAFIAAMTEFVDFQIGNVRHLIVPTILQHNDFVLRSRQLQLSMQILHQLVAGAFVGRYEY